MQNRNCTVAFASLMAPDECVRCSVLLQSGQEELLEEALDLQLGDSSGAKGNSWVGKSWFEGCFQGRAGAVSRGIEQLEVQPHWSSGMALGYDDKQDGLKGPEKLSSHQRASVWFSHVPSLRVEAQLAQVRQQPPPHQRTVNSGCCSDIKTMLRVLHWAS